MMQSIASLSFSAPAFMGIAAGTAVGAGFFFSAIRNRKELSRIYSEAKAQVLSEQLPTIIFNLQTYINSQKAQKISQNIIDRFTLQAVKTTEEYAAKLVVQALAEAIGSQIGLDGTVLKQAVHPSMKKEVNGFVSQGRETRFGFVKQLFSPVTNPVCHTVSNAWGATCAQRMEENGELQQLVQQMSLRSWTGRVKTYRSINPLYAGPISAITNIFFNTLALLAITSGYLHGKVIDYFSWQTPFEVELNKFLKDRDGFGPSSSQIAQHLGLKSLGEKRYWSAFTAPISFARNSVTWMAKGKQSLYGLFGY